FPDAYPETLAAGSDISTRALGLRQVDRFIHTQGDSATVNFIVQAVTNQVEVAPASAWLGRITDPAEKAAFIMNCIDCHQGRPPKCAAMPPASPTCMRPIPLRRAVRAGTPS